MQQNSLKLCTEKGRNCFGRLQEKRIILPCRFSFFCYHFCMDSQLQATTSRKRPLLVSDHLVNNSFHSHLNTISKTLPYKRPLPSFLSDREHLKARNLTYSFIFCFWPCGQRPPDIITYENHCSNVTKVKFLIALTEGADKYIVHCKNSVFPNKVSSPIIGVPKSCPLQSRKCLIFLLT